MSDTGLLSDFLDLEPFAKQVARDKLTVRRWLDEPNGLPYTRIGNRILIHVPTAREWIFSRMRNRAKINPPAPRKPRANSRHAGSKQSD
jgi:hypothetical protein